MSIITGDSGKASMLSVSQLAAPSRENTAPKIFEVTASKSTMLDVAVVDTVGRVRALGLSRELFPTSDLVMYRDALRALVTEEVSLFARRTQGRELPLAEDQLIEGAVHALGELIRHLRKKLILELVSGTPAAPQAPRASGAAAPKKKPKRQSR